MQDMIIFPEDMDLLNITLEPLVHKAELLLAALINKDGRLLTYRGDQISADIVSLAALIAGNSASTLAIAHLLGENEFDAMYHHGKEKHIYVTNIDTHTFMALVFDSRTNIDRVKVFVRQHEKPIKAALTKVYNKTQPNQDLNLNNLVNTSQNSVNKGDEAAQNPESNSENVMYFEAPVTQPDSPK
ncbi:dynein regulation protein LC7 [Chitinispirillum alkaliphilum]|nr:dynein regulation protein LC7 [Chitinispirillum alkaliphilum]